MPLLRYKAMDTLGRIRTGQMEAVNAADLELRLDRMGLDLIRSGEVTRKARSIKKIGRRELISFCFHLEQLVSAGVPLLEGLGDLRDSVEDVGLREMIIMLMEHIEGGKTLSRAMEEFPRVFDKTLIMPIRAGESSGRLGEVLQNIIENLKWVDETVAQVRKLLLYPVMVGGIVVATVFFLMMYLVPKLISFFEMMGQTLPAHTRLLISASDFFVDWWYLITDSACHRVWRLEAGDDNPFRAHFPRRTFARNLGDRAHQEKDHSVPVRQLLRIAVCLRNYRPRLYSDQRGLDGKQGHGSGGKTSHPRDRRWGRHKHRIRTCRVISTAGAAHVAGGGEYRGIGCRPQECELFL
uniref:Type II secretion system (T2SS), protein F n=1 Tax=Candidatus Kentrum sp. LFY TaxID=2126342 RepID=A0A450V432_9GAMM|nr:MAG: Type II secretion system (T2SS), protein F [Candidatus Kentron sp. LFY]